MFETSGCNWFQWFQFNMYRGKMPWAESVLYLSQMSAMNLYNLYCINSTCALLLICYRDCYLSNIDCYWSYDAWILLTLSVTRNNDHELQFVRYYSQVLCQIRGIVERG